MKIKVKQNLVSIQPEKFMREAGYKMIVDRRRDAESYVRTFGNQNYPRFHVYIDKVDDITIYNLHLDQKQPSYQGVSAHNGEYDGEVVEKEVSRLKALLQNHARI